MKIVIRDTTSVVSVRKAELNKRGIANFEEWKARPNSVYIGRNMSFYVPGATGSIWGNPFSAKKYPLSDSLQLYEEYIRSNRELMAELSSLRGKELGCWCKPNPCHGDILIKLLSELR